MVTLAAGWERKRGAREEAGAPERGAGVQEGGDDGLSLGRDSVQGRTRGLRIWRWAEQGGGVQTDSARELRAEGTLGRSGCRSWEDRVW